MLMQLWSMDDGGPAFAAGLPSINSAFVQSTFEEDEEKFNKCKEAVAGCVSQCFQLIRSETMNSFADCLRSESDEFAVRLSMDMRATYRQDLAAWEEKAEQINELLEEQRKSTDEWLENLNELRERLTELEQRLPELEQEIREI